MELGAGVRNTSVVAVTLPESSAQAKRRTPVVVVVTSFTCTRRSSRVVPHIGDHPLPVTAHTRGRKSVKSYADWPSTARMPRAWRAITRSTSV
jgi:hypothetical protein